MPTICEHEIQNLLKQVEVYINAKKLVKANYEPRLAEDFSPIELFSINEMDISKILAYFLNPRASHAQGTLFLDEFCDAVSKLPPLSEASESNPLPDSFRLSANTSVNTEVADAESGRMDILIFDNENALCIENKPWASDQDGQLKRYGEKLQKQGFKNWLLIYLCDHEPSESSTNNDEKTLKHTVQLSFSSLGAVLLAASRKALAPNVRYFVESFANYLIQNIAGESKMNDEQTRKLIKDNIDSAKVISEAFEKLSELTWQNFCKTLERQCNNSKYKDSLTFEYREDIHTLRTRCHFRFKPKAKDWYISFEKTHPSRLQQFYWGITVNGGVNEIERQEIEVKMKSLFKTGDSPERWWPWWVWGSDETEVIPTDLRFFPKNLDSQQWINEMSSDDGGELSKIVWRIVDHIMQAIEKNQL